MREFLGINPREAGAAAAVREALEPGPEALESALDSAQGVAREPARGPGPAKALAARGLAQA